MSKTFPFEIQQLDTELCRKLSKDFQGFNAGGYVQVLPKKYIFGLQYEKYASDFYNFEVKPDDVWVVTFPRSGTTLTQELVWLISNNLDYDKASKFSLNRRFPFIDMTFMVPDELKTIMSAGSSGAETSGFEDAADTLNNSLIDNVKELKSPRFIKTHLPFSLLPPSLPDTAKCITVVRNPKDAAVSYYYHNRLIAGINYSGDFETYWNYFQQDLISPCPYWEHVKESWELRNHPNILFLYYEDIITDWQGTIRKVANFLGKTLTDDEVNKLAEHMHIDNFRKNKSVNMEMDKMPGLLNEGEQGFVREGKNHGSKAEFTPELNEKADKWITENLAKMPKDFKLPIKIKKSKL